MGFFNIDKAVFMDEGLEVGKKVIPTIFFKKNFKYKDRSFIIDLKVKNDDGYLCSFKRWGLIWNTIYTIYDVNHALPLRIDDKKLKPPLLDTDFLNIMFENKTARDLNNLSESKLKKIFSARNIIIGSIVLFILYLFFTGNYKTLFGIG